MGDVVNLFGYDKDDLNHCVYGVDEYDAICVQMIDSPVSVRPLNQDSIQLTVNSESIIISREALGEFSKVVSVLLDSEGRWTPDVELISMNYDD